MDLQGNIRRGLRDEWKIDKADNKEETKTINRGVKALRGSKDHTTTRPTNTLLQIKD